MAPMIPMVTQVVLVMAVVIVVQPRRLPSLGVIALRFLPPLVAGTP